MRIVLYCLLVFLVSPLVVAKSSIRVVTENLPPYQIVESGKVIGGTAFNVVTELLRRAKLNERIEALPWARAYSIALQEKNVMIFSLSRTPERENLLNWVGKLNSSQYYFYSVKNDKSIIIDKPKDANKYKAVSVRGSFEASALNKMGFEEGRNLILTTGYRAAWKVLLKGRAQVIYASGTFLSRMRNEGVPESTFTHHPQLIASHDLYIAASLGTNPVTLKKLRDIYSDMIADGTIEKWMGDNPPIQ